MEREVRGSGKGAIYGHTGTHEARVAMGACGLVQAVGAAISGNAGACWGRLRQSGSCLLASFFLLGVLGGVRQRGRR